MAARDMEKRVENVESQLAEIRAELLAAKQVRSKDWRRAIGAFTGDSGMQQILRHAMKLREADRKRSKRRLSDN
jgi:hypothetical protein